MKTKHTILGLALLGLITATAACDNSSIPPPSAPVGPFVPVVPNNTFSAPGAASALTDGHLAGAWKSQEILYLDANKQVVMGDQTYHLNVDAPGVGKSLLMTIDDGPDTYEYDGTFDIEPGNVLVVHGLDPETGKDTRYNVTITGPDSMIWSLVSDIDSQTIAWKKVGP